MKRILSLLMAVVLLVGLIPFQADAVQGGKLIAITFDDGPSPSHTGRLLDGLKERGVKVTFFCQGSAADANMSLLERAYADGHEIGSHTWNHPELTTISDDAVRSQLSRTEAVFDKVCGSKAEYLVRPPYGSTNEHTRSLIPNPLILWSVDTRDWELLNTYSVRDMILQEAYDGAIILLHDIHGTSVDGALLAIDKLLQQGYELVTVSELYRRRGEPLEDGVRYYHCKNNGTDLGPIPMPKITYTTDKVTMDITITADTDAPIYYTTDGSTPNSDSPVYTGPFTVKYPCNIRAVAAYQMNGSRSDTAVLAPGQTPCESPVISVENGVMTLTCGTEGVDMYYTLDGSKATTKSTLYTGPVKITGDHYIRAVSGGGFYKTSKETVLYCSPRFNLFADVSPDDWFMDSIDRMVAEGLIYGIGDYKMAPGSKLTRGMLVAILYRYSGEDLGNAWIPSHSFRDVPDDAYYAEAVQWAYSRGIVSGYSETQFGPNGNLTRQELCKVIDYFLIYRGNRLPMGDSCKGVFADYGRIAPWALYSVEAMVSAGLIFGDGTNMRPTGTATRAEVAAILARVMDYEASCIEEKAIEPTEPVVE